MVAVFAGSRPEWQATGLVAGPETVLVVPVPVPGKEAE